jgi:hypothetical protein
LQITKAALPTPQPQEPLQASERKGAATTPTMASERASTGFERSSFSALYHFRRVSCWILKLISALRLALSPKIHVGILP